MDSPLNNYFRAPDSLYNFRLPDELFLIGHDEFSGRPRVAKPLLGCGLVGAVLSELLAAQRITVSEGRVRATAAELRTDDRADYLMSLVAAQPHDQRVRVWCLNLGDALYTQTANALMRAGILDRDRPWWSRNTPRYPANDLYQSGRPLRLLERMLTGASAPDAQRVMLAGLLLAVGGERLLDLTAAGTTPAELHQLVNEQLATLPAQFGQLRGGVDDAVAQLATSAT